MMPMHKINLLTLDFNLLLVLSALLEERNVTNAGERIGLSQSATSHALGRLRQVFNDPQKSALSERHGSYTTRS
jgi:hypothetical protein